jgi:hypothetical protein
MQKCLTIDDVKKFLTKRELENCLRESGAFSKSAATYLASCFEPKQCDTAAAQSDQLETLVKEVARLEQYLKEGKR